MERSLLKCTLDSVSLTNCKLKLFLQKNICLASPGLCSIGQYGHFNLKTRKKTLNQETGSVLSIQFLSSYRVSCNNYTHRYACLCTSITVLSLNSSSSVAISEKYFENKTKTTVLKTASGVSEANSIFFSPRFSLHPSQNDFQMYLSHNPHTCSKTGASC